MDDETKQKISQSTKGKSKSYSHKQNISRGMKEYWKSIPYRDSKNNLENPDADNEL